MKTFHLLSIILGVLIILMWNLITIVPPQGSLEASRLSREPEKWSIDVEKGLFPSKTESEIKQNLIIFMETHNNSQYFPVPYMTATGLIMVIFGGIGLWQQNRIKELKTQNHPIDRTSQAQSGHGWRCENNENSNSTHFRSCWSNHWIAPWWSRRLQYFIIDHTRRPRNHPHIYNHFCSSYIANRIDFGAIHCNSNTEQHQVEVT